MAKGYWITFYRSISKPEAIAEYAKLALPAIAAGGGRALARGNPAGAFEEAKDARTVLIEFDSVQQALATYQGAEYQAARKLLEGAVERDVRIMEGV
jgi:uncharacterized protein (DUF1330 family)